MADALAPEGTLALIQYFGLREQRSADDQEALLPALPQTAPEIAGDLAHLPRPRWHDCGRAGAP